MVNGGQGDVLIAAAVAGDEVAVEQLVVVGAGGAARCPVIGVVVGGQHRAGLAVHRVGAMRDVVQEGVVGAKRADGERVDWRSRGADGHHIVVRVQDAVVAGTEDDLREAGVAIRE